MSKMIKLDAERLAREWESSRWQGIQRDYSAEDVLRLRGSLAIEHTLARRGAERLWSLMHELPYVAALGALTGNQAVQQVKAGLKAIYLSGWQVAGDANLGETTYPDQSLYPANSVPSVVRRINNALRRADQITWTENKHDLDWFAPIVADAEAGFGGPLNAYELMRAMIEAGAAGVHYEDQLASEKKCGHLGGKVLVPTGQFIRTLTAARLAADVCGVPSVLIARTDALSAELLTSDHDPRDRQFLTGDRTAEGLLPRARRPRRGDRALARVRAVRRRHLVRDVDAGHERRARVRRGVHAEFPGKLLAYNCSPSFNWRKHLNDDEIARFQKELGGLGYKFLFVTLAGFHAINASMFELARGYARERHDRIRRAAGARVRARGRRLHGDASPARGRRRLLRRGRAGDLGRAVVDAGAEGLDRGGAVRAGGATGSRAGVAPL